MLKVNLAVVADAANLSREGKLNIMGIFNNISSATFPVNHPWMALVFVVEGTKADTGSEHKMHLDFIGEDGKSLIPPFEGTMRFADPGPGGKIYAPQFFQFANMRFEAPGRYEFRIVINGEQRASAEIMVTMVEQKENEAGAANN